MQKYLNDIIDNLYSEYIKKKSAIEINFRELLPKLSKRERATHIIHRYPAKLLMHIPYFFLNNDLFCKKGDTVLDPFCGSGTVLLEAIIAQKHAIGSDSNPLARLISNVKVTKYNIDSLMQKKELILKKILKKEGEDNNIFFKNIEYWYSKEIIKTLSLIYSVIHTEKNKIILNFFLVCFSNLVRKVSYADPKISVPVKVKKQITMDFDYIIELFINIINSNIKRFKNYLSLLYDSSDYRLYKIFNDARRIDLLNKKVDLIITSPPYAGAQKYIRACSLNLGWLNYINGIKTVSDLNKKSIGREQYNKNEYLRLIPTGIDEADLILKDIYNKNPLRAYIAANYLLEMNHAFCNSVQVLKKGGYFILIAANNNVCGHCFQTQKYLIQLLKNYGLKVELQLVDDIKSYGLMTKRNKTANIISREWITVLKK
jgi:tRNA G10  N-methylase Trm11